MKEHIRVNSFDPWQIAMPIGVISSNSCHPDDVSRRFRGSRRLVLLVRHFSHNGFIKTCLTSALRSIHLTEKTYSNLNSDSHQSLPTATVDCQLKTLTFARSKYSHVQDS